MVGYQESRISITAVLLSCMVLTVSADDTRQAGTPEDDAYAAKLWSYMEANRFLGEDRIRSFPFVGSRPHGSIQELIATEAVIDGHRGRLLIKHNFGADEKLTPRSVYSADPQENSEPLAIMFQRKAGYDPENNNWFWAEYTADGAVLNFQGNNLSGRAPLCIGCHTAQGGKDREILNGGGK